MPDKNKVNLPPCPLHRQKLAGSIEEVRESPAYEVACYRFVFQRFNDNMKRLMPIKIAQQVPPA
jgi:hypothetical protein